MLGGVLTGKGAGPCHVDVAGELRQSVVCKDSNQQRLVLQLRAGAEAKGSSAWDCGGRCWEMHGMVQLPPRLPLVARDTSHTLF